MRTRALALWFVAAFAWCWAHDAAGRPITADNRLYFFLAERAASGVAPHVSLVDPKNQLGVLVSAGAMSAGRAAGVDDVTASRVASVAFASAAVALAADVAARVAGVALAGHAAALALLATRGFADHAAIGSNPKLFLVAFALAAHALLARRGRGADDGLFAAAGLAAGCAFLCWQPALVVVAAVVVEAFVAKPRGGLGAAARAVAAALVAVGAYEAWFASHGALAEQIRQAYVMTLGSVHEMPRLLPSLRYVVTESGGPAAWPRVGPVAFALLAATGVVATWRDPRASLAALRARPGLASLVVASTASVAFTLYDHQGLPDLFFPAPYFAVAAGVAVVLVALAAGRGAALAALAVLVAQAVHTDGRRPAATFSLADQRRAASALAAARADGDETWAYEAVHLLGLAHLDNHVPLALFFDDVLASVDPASFRPLREGRLPGLVVTVGTGAPATLPWLGELYRNVTPADFEAQGLGLWRLRGSARAGIPGQTS